MRSSLVLVVVLAGAIAVRGQEPQAPVFRTSTSAVTVDVSVKDRSGRVMTGLTAADLMVQDNGVPQEVAEVSYGKLPIDVTVALDVSYSVTGPLLERLRRAVTQLMRELRKEDRVKLMLFNMRVTRTVDFTGDWAQIEKAMQQVSAGGGTSLFDTLSVAMVSAAHPDRRQLIVFFTDGNDGSSTTPAATLTQIAERTRATVSFVVLPTFTAVPTLAGASARQSIAAIDPAIQRVATDTGGSVVMATAADLGLVFLRALDAFRTTYVLHYSPRGVERAGFHTITVQVNRPDAVVHHPRVHL